MYDIKQVKSVYDELTTKVKADLDKQFNLGRLKGSDYAEVYAKLMDECLQLAFEAPLKEAELSTQKRQKQGFDDNIKLKLFEAQINAWSMMFSNGMLDTAPAIISNDELKELYCKMMDELGLCSYDDCENRNP